MVDTEACVRPRGGRPRTFDRQAAVTVAMRLFWQRGYEGVSVNDLTAAIGIAPPSLYAAFGSKADLYREALDQYVSGPDSLDLSVMVSAASPEDAIKSLLHAAIASVSRNGRACMVLGGMLACRPEHDRLAQDLAHRRRAFEVALRDELLRWFTPDVAAATARYLIAVTQGISVHVRDGATVAELESIADLAVNGLPPPRGS